MSTYIVCGLLIVFWAAAVAVWVVAATLAVVDIRAARRRAKPAQKRGFPWAWDK